MNQFSHMGGRKKKEELKKKTAFHLVQYELSQISNLARAVKQRKKNSPHWVENMTCMLSVPLKFWRGYQMTHGLRAWCLMIGFLYIIPRQLRGGPEKLKLTLDIMNALNTKVPGWVQAASLKELDVSQDTQSPDRVGARNQPAGYKAFTSV